MKRSMRAISACCLSIALPSAISRAACSRRQLCQRAGEEARAAGLELQHGGADGLQEPAVVRDQHDRRVEARQRLLEPLQRLDVEVVGGLVQQQHVRARRERAGERGARQLPAGEGVQRTLQVLLARSPSPRVITVARSRHR